MKPQLSIVIPAYNEADNFKKNKLAAVYEYLSKQQRTFELLLVDDGSTDSTAVLLQQFAEGKLEVKVLAEPHRGKAWTVKTGMLAASGAYRLFTDFDQSTPIQEIETVLPFFDRGYDIVIGSREVAGAVREREPWYRHIMGKGFNFGVQLIAVHGIQDTQCGFKMMSEKAAKSLFPRLRVTMVAAKGAFTGAFDVELLFLARKSGYRIAEVPVQWKHVKSIRVSPIKDSLRMAWQVILIRWSFLTGRYAQ